MRALVTGATGFVGPHVLKRLDRPAVLSRNAAKAKESLAQFNISAAHDWDPMAGPPPAAAFDGIDAVIHLAGDPVASRRWNEEKKRAIRESRVQGTRNLVEGLRRLERRPPVLVSASAVGWYGSRGDEVQDESAPPADDFLAEVCVAWEREAREAEQLGIRVVTVRVGVVLGKEGGAIQKMLMPFKLGVGGPLGSGKQWMPWIHVDDMAAMFVHAAEKSQLSGPMNGVAPNSVTNKEFTKAFAAALHRPAIIPTPYFALRLMIGEFAQVLFASQRVVPKVPMESGFQFRYPTIREAMAAIFPPELTMPHTYELEHKQFVRRPLAEVFGFFADAGNLETITPKSLRFQILSPRPIAMQPGTVIEYKLRLMGIRFHWKTLIETFEPMRRFTDSQAKGPYRLWHHTHEFIEQDDGVLIVDRVRYQLPLGLLGRFAHALFVRRQLAGIFEFRRQKIEEAFGGPASAVGQAVQT